MFAYVKSKRLNIIISAIFLLLFLVSFSLLLSMYQQIPLLSRTNCLHEFATFDTPEAEWLFKSDATAEWFPAGVRGDNKTGYPYFIVPNIVHYILLDVIEISFVHYISIKSVLTHHKPDKIIIHCNCDTISGEYWSKLLSSTELRGANRNKLVVRKISKPSTVYGMNFSEKYHNYHLSDVLRNRILMEYGGIYLDRDMYVVKSLNRFRKFELTLGFDAGCSCMGTQIQIAHKRARFLRLYLQTYQNYVPNQWYFNAGKYPTLRIINKYPHLIHRVDQRFGVTSTAMCEMLYKQDVSDWRTNYFTIHMLMRDANITHTKWCFKGELMPPQIYFDEQIIKTSRTTFGQMARLVFYNTTHLIFN